MARGSAAMVTASTVMARAQRMSARKEVSLNRTIYWRADGSDLDFDLNVELCGVSVRYA
jgi:hypothetical protein